ncbi:MAG TPA: glycosyltransferase [Amaricoccus sp.]|nr:glycosyltransferase [Amaricoccus sp.]
MRPPEPLPAAPRAAGARPLVSLFVTAYRQERLVRAAIESAFAQTWAPLEILLSDDCSPDGTYRVMQEMAAAYRGPHRVILNRNPRNLGITAHVDRIMELTAGDFVVQLAGDDVATPDRAAKLAGAWLASGRRLKAIHSARRRMDEAGGVHEVIDDGRVLAGMTPLAVIRDHGTLVGATLGWDRDLWRVFGPLGGTPVFDDFPTAFRASLIGGIGYLPEPLLHYRMGGTSSRPAGAVGQNYLRGFRIKGLRWHRSFWRAYLEAMAVVAPPDAAECRWLLHRKISEADFAIGLAEASWGQILAQLPRNAARSLLRRDPTYLRETAKYLASPLYRRRLDAKAARAEARRLAPDPHPAPHAL